MPQGRIQKIVHLMCGAAALDGADLVPTHNYLGYGFIEADGQTVYFEPKAVSGARWDELQTGQPVEVQLDPKAPVATRVTPLAAGG